MPEMSIVEAIRTAGQHLCDYFPCAVDDVNELSNEINIEP